MTRWKSEKGISSSYRSLISPGQNILNVEFSPRGIHLVSQMIKSLPAMRETHIQSLGWEDPLEKEIAIHSSILAWKIPWMEEPGRPQSTGPKRVGHAWVTSTHKHIQGLSVFSGSVNPLNELMVLCYSFQLAVLYADKSTQELLKELAGQGSVSVYPCTRLCASTAVRVVSKRLHFLSYPNMHELCNHHAHPPPPPPTRKHDCLLLTVLKQSRHSKAAALQGCTAPVGHFLGCHSLGKHLLVSVTVTQHGHAAETPTPHPQHQIEMSKHCTRSLQDWDASVAKGRLLGRHLRCPKQCFSAFIDFVCVWVTCSSC